MVILKDTIFLGVGADQFGFLFPHQDYVARYKYDLSETYYKKLFWIIYIKRGIKELRHREMARFCDYLACAITFSVIAYLVTAVFNDSFLTVAPVFWCLAGVGEGLRFRKIRRKSSGATWISPLDIT